MDRERHRWVQLDAGTDGTRTTFDIFDAAGVFLGALMASHALPQYSRLALGREQAVVADGLPVVVRYAVRK